MSSEVPPWKKEAEAKQLSRQKSLDVDIIQQQKKIAAGPPALEDSDDEEPVVREPPSAPEMLFLLLQNSPMLARKGYPCRSDHGLRYHAQQFAAKQYVE